MAVPTGLSLEELTGTNASGEPSWAYVLVPTEHLATFRKAIAQGAHISEYGEVLAAGLGTPPIDIREALLDLLVTISN
jgi:hypothetical protein